MKNKDTPLSEKELQQLYSDYIPMSFYDNLKLIKEEELWRQENSSIATGFMQIHRNKAMAERTINNDRK